MLRIVPPKPQPCTVFGPQYCIATPSRSSSEEIVPHLPCILFIHSEYLGPEVFEAQFRDPQLRLRFNLIAVDMHAVSGTAATKGGSGKSAYTPTDAAEDLYRFVRSLDLPAIHIFGLAIGSSVAVELATLHPDLVLSLTLCSPLPNSEPQDIADGRREVWNLWTQAVGPTATNSNTDLATIIHDHDHSIISDVVLGTRQLCFNNQRTNLTNALTEVGIRRAMQLWSGTHEKLELGYNATVGMFINRRPPSLSALSRISCPIRLIHCAEDIAYPLSDAQDLELLLRQAGLRDVALHRISSAPHYGNVFNSQTINSILIEVALSASASSNQLSKFHHSHRHDSCHHQLQLCPSSPTRMITPFTKSLRKHGYCPNLHEDDSDSDCDSDHDHDHREDDD